jgi:hypothetical protein
MITNGHWIRGQDEEEEGNGEGGSGQNREEV